MAEQREKKTWRDERLSTLLVLLFVLALGG
jgi:hypothetical protein